MSTQKYGHVVTALCPWPLNITLSFLLIHVQDDRRTFFLKGRTPQCAHRPVSLLFILVTQTGCLLWTTEELMLECRSSKHISHLSLGYSQWLHCVSYTSLCSCPASLTPFLPFLSLFFIKIFSCSIFWSYVPSPHNSFQTLPTSPTLCSVFKKNTKYKTKTPKTRQKMPLQNKMG